jgi:predicted RNase H-like HicB family nuclease
MEPIRVIYHHEPDGWWAESPGVAGWYAAASTYEDCRKLAEEGIRFALERDDVSVEHYVLADERVSA